MVNGDVRAPLEFQNHNLVVKGYVRNLAQVDSIRTLQVKLGSELDEVAKGPWGWTTRGNVWVGLHYSQQLQSPRTIPDLRGRQDGQWELDEMSKPIDGLIEQEAEIEELRSDQVKGSHLCCAKFNAPNARRSLFKILVWANSCTQSCKRSGLRERLQDLEIPVAEDEEVEGIEMPGLGGIHQGGNDLGDQQV